MTNTKKVYLIFGPTAVGKSQIISYISKKRSISLISADSVQVFSKLDIGSAKPSADEMKKYPHHLINIRSPFETFNVFDFISLADRAVLDSYKEGRIPVVSGGSAYYFKHFIYGLSDAPASNVDIRKQVDEMFNTKGLDYLYAFLLRIDPEYAAKVDSRNTLRIKRAVEVYIQTGRPLSSFKIPNKPRNQYEFKIFALYRSKEQLIRRINMRLDSMFDNGLIEEVKYLKSIGLTLKHQCMNSIGYKEFFLYDNINDIKEQILKNTIHYAKRQMTFFRSLDTDCTHIKWICLGGDEI